MNLIYKNEYMKQVLFKFSSVVAYLHLSVKDTVKKLYVVLTFTNLLKNIFLIFWLMRSSLLHNIWWGYIMRWYSYIFIKT